MKLLDIKEGEKEAKERKQRAAHKRFVGLYKELRGIASPTENEQIMLRRLGAYIQWTQKIGFDESGIQI